MKKNTLLALAAGGMAAALAVACGSSSSNGSGEQSSGSAGSSGNGSSGGGTSTDGGGTDATTYSAFDGGPSITTMFACMSASTCAGQKCCGTTEYGADEAGAYSIAITSACADSCGTGLTSFQLCASADECTSGDSCQSLAGAYGGGGAGAASGAPDITICLPEAGALFNRDAGFTMDGGCYYSQFGTYCPDGGFMRQGDASTTTPSEGGTTTDGGTTADGS